MGSTDELLCKKFQFDALSKDFVFERLLIHDMTKADQQLLI
jgi:hypothetical protein